MSVADQGNDHLNTIIMCGSTNLLTAILIGLVIATPSLGKEAKAINLFNGKNLRGWKAHLSEPDVKKKDVWSVKDGILICKGEPLGYLYTAKDYTSYKLLVEWRWAPGGEPGNSGVLMRINGKPQGIPRCIEAQLRSGSAGDLYGFRGMRIKGDPARMREAKGHELLGDMVGVSKIEGNENEPGQWNTYDITAHGPKITVLVNGKKLNEAFDCDVLTGPIGFQSEGGEIHFRNIQLIPIKD